jgi:hypothetical protein
MRMQACLSCMVIACYSLSLWRLFSAAHALSLAKLWTGFTAAAELAAGRAMSSVVEGVSETCQVAAASAL